MSRLNGCWEEEDASSSWLLIVAVAMPNVEGCWLVLVLFAKYYVEWINLR